MSILYLFAYPTITLTTFHPASHNPLTPYHHHFQKQFSRPKAPYKSNRPPLTCISSNTPLPTSLPAPQPHPTPETPSQITYTIQTSLTTKTPNHLLQSFSQLLNLAGPRPRRHINPPLLPQLWHQSVTFLFRRGVITSGLRVLYIGEEIIPLRLIKRRSYVECLKVLVRKGRWKSLEVVIGRMWGLGVDGCPDERLIAMVANGCVEGGRVDLAVRFIGDMERRGIGAGVFCYSVLLKGYGRKKRGVMVGKVVDGIVRRGLKWDVVLLNAAVDAFVRCGLMDEAERFVGEGVGGGVGGLANVRTYNTLLKGFAQRKMVIKAFSIADTMKTLGILPDTVTINSLILACVRTGKYAEAWELIDSQWNVMEKVKARGNGPGVSESLMLNRQMVIALTTIISGVAQSGQIDQALNMLDEMEKRGVKPSRVTYTAMMSACLRFDRTQQALNIFNDMRELRSGKEVVEAATYNALLVGLAQTGNEKSANVAEKLLYDMLHEDKVQVNETSFNAVMDGWVRAGFVDRAEKLMRLLKRTGIHLTSVPYTTLIKGHSQQGRFEDAKFWFREASANGVKMDRVCLNTFIAASSRAGEFELTENTLAYMEKTGGDFTPNHYSYSPLIAVKCRDGDVEGTCRIYKRMRTAGIRANAYIVEMTMNCLITAGPSYVASGRREEKEAFLTSQAVAVLRDAFRAGIHTSQSVEWRRSLTNMIRSGKLQSNLNSFREPTAKTHGKASQEIFRRHNWNPIDSGWRVL